MQCIVNMFYVAKNMHSEKRERERERKKLMEFLINAINITNTKIFIQNSIKVKHEHEEHEQLLQPSLCI